MRRELNPLTDYYDRRRGLWTSFEIQPQRIVFRRGRPQVHWIVHLFLIGVITMLIAGMVQSPFGIFLMAILVLFVILGWFDQHKSDQQRFPIVISKNYTDDTSTFKHGRLFNSVDVQQIQVRENTHRDAVEDSHLIQIYMQIEGAKYYVLLHQDYYTDERVEKINRIADDFRRWLKLST